MANSIFQNATLSLVSSSFNTQSLNSPSASFVQTGTNYSSGTLTTNDASATIIPVGSIGTVGFVQVTNTEAAGGSDVISLRNGSGGSNFISLPAQASASFYLASGISLYAISGSGTPSLSYLLIEL